MKRYTREHEWIRLEADGRATVGITDHAQAILGDITFVDLPKVGKAARQGETLCVIESVKAASDVLAPAGGRVASVNARLTDEPELINRSAEDEGWICALEGVSAAEVAGLMDEARYAAFRGEK